MYIGFRKNCCILIMISIIIIIQILIQADSVVSDTNRFINFWLQSLRHEERDTNHKSLCSPYYVDSTPNARRILWCLRSLLVETQTDLIWSDLKKSTAHFNGRTQLICFFYFLKFSGTSVPDTTSSTDSIHSNGPPAPFPVWGFIMTDDRR